MFELSNGFCMGGVSKGKINLVKLSNVRVNVQSSYRMLTVYIYITSPSVSVASRRITLLQRPLRDLCLLVFGATRLKETTNNIIFEISMLDYPICRWNKVNPTIFEICLLYENNNKYSY